MADLREARPDPGRDDGSADPGRRGDKAAASTFGEGPRYVQLPRSLDEQRAMMTFGMVEPLPADRRPKPIGAFVLPTPIDADRFFIRATHERGVGVPSSRSLATASREAT